jgi:hypothetical protein
MSDADGNDAVSDGLVDLEDSLELLFLQIR